MYGLPEHVDDYHKLQQVAYDHRVHSNILHHSHNTAAPGARKSNLDMRLRSGRRMDNRRYDDIASGAKSAYWDDFAEAFGPVLDGSLFASGRRGAIPVFPCRKRTRRMPKRRRTLRSLPMISIAFANVRFTC